MPRTVLTTPKPTGAQLAGPAVEIEWAPTSAAWDAPSYARFNGRVRSWSLQHGRKREFDHFAPTRITAVLDNADRFADPSYTGGPWYGEIDVNRQMRVGLRIGGVYYPLGKGYIDGWPQAIDYVTSRFSTVQLSALGPFSLLSQPRLPSSMFELAVLTDRPDHYWKLDDTATAGAFADSGYSTPSALSPSAGGITYSGSQAILFDGGRSGITLDGVTGRVTGSFPNYSTARLNGGWTIEWWMKGQATFQNVLAFGSALGGFFYVQLDQALGPSGDGGQLIVEAGSTGPQVDDNVGHHIVLVGPAGGGNALIYVDGVLFGTAVTAFATACTNGIDRLSIAFLNQLSSSTPGPNSGKGMSPCSYTFAGVAIYGYALTSTQVATHYTAGKTGFAGTDPGTLAARALAFAGLPSTAYSIQTGNATLGGYDPPGGPVFDFLQQLMVDNERGRCFEDLNGVVQGKRRTDVLTATISKNSQATFGDASALYPFTQRTMNTTSGSTAVAAVSPVFTAADVGAVIAGPGIPAGTTLAAQAGATGTLSTAATLTQTAAPINSGELAWAKLMPEFDSSRVWNDAIRGRTGGAQQRAQSAPSVRQRGLLSAPSQTNLLVQTDTQARGLAQLVPYLYSAPTQRYSSVRVELLDNARGVAVAQLVEGARITLVDRHAQVGGVTVADYIVQGMRYTGEPGKIVCDIDVDSIETTYFWIWDDVRTTWSAGVPWGP